MLPEQVAQVKLNNIWLYPLRFSNEKIHSNMLFGNQFHITLRAISHAASETTERLESVFSELLKFGGCPNFYGHQRFGTTRPITHLVGKYILENQWQKAALTFLAKPSPYEEPESRRAREQLWNTQDYLKALRSFPHKLVYERQMLNHLAKQPKDFTGAFYRLPKKLCQLFVQAYQSYLFNRFLSQRMQCGLPLKETRDGEFKLKIDSEELLALPLVGYKQSFSMGEQGEIEKEILEREGIVLEDFKVSSMPKISSPGRLRTALTPLIGLNIEKPVKDDAYIKKKLVRVDFTLRKGSYATIVMREFMKPLNPIEAGF